jgi:Family of unknown function (DUF5329)
MKTRTFIRAGFLSLLAFAAAPSLTSGEIAAPEKAKIEALLAHVEKLEGAAFIRNGKDYDPKTAAKFLRGKWEANAKEILTASDFIAKAATKSSTSGKPYLIRPKGAPETPCADYLTAQLKLIEATGRK